MKELELRFIRKILIKTVTQFITYLKGHFYSEQDRTLLRVLFWKLKKIWKILIGKDFYYSEIIMTKDEYEEFKGYINQF